MSGIGHFPRLRPVEAQANNIGCSDTSFVRAKNSMRKIRAMSGGVPRRPDSFGGQVFRGAVSVCVAVMTEIKRLSAQQRSSGKINVWHPT